MDQQADVGSYCRVTLVCVSPLFAFHYVWASYCFLVFALFVFCPL